MARYGSLKVAMAALAILGTALSGVSCQSAVANANASPDDGRTVVDVALQNGLNDLGAALTKVTLVPMVTSACQPLPTYHLKLLEAITLCRLSLWTLLRAMVHSPSSALLTEPLRPWPRCSVSRSLSFWNYPTWLTSSRTTSLPERSWQKTSWTGRRS